MNHLNPAQYQTVTAPMIHTLIIAGAGSGKTMVLVNRVAYLIQEMHLSPQNILAVTFTNKAALEMKTRLSTTISSALNGLWVGTFHGLCHRLLRRHFLEAKLPQLFQILDSDDQARLLKKMIAGLNLDPEQWPAKKAQHYINARKDEGIRAAKMSMPQSSHERTWLRIYQAYEKACQDTGVIDFAELILRCYELFRDNPKLLADYQARFKYILVDEFQDTNHIQYAWIKCLAGADCTVMAVGDDDQSIYGWRGAQVENIHRFMQDFTPHEVIRLEQNYRSTQTILTAANALITHNSQRMGKDLWTEGHTGEKIVLFRAFNDLEEAYFVCERVQMAMAQGISPLHIAILYRSNAQSRVMEESLIRRGIPYRIHGGMRFFERAEIKDALAYARLLSYVHDDAAFERVVNLPTRGIGEKTLVCLRELAQSQSSSLWSAAQAVLDTALLTTRAKTALSHFLALIQTLQNDTQDLDLASTFSAILNKTGLKEHFRSQKGGEGIARIENLDELINAAMQFSEENQEDNYSEEEQELPLLASFLAHVSLESGETQAAEHEAYVSLMTLHSAKGLEFPWVFMVGMEEGIFPSRQSLEDPSRLEEERRLCYVGMTRAMRVLIMSYAELRRQYGREEYHTASRFIREIPSELLDEVRPKAKYGVRYEQ
jgi:DNA helicase-2/ATP-dependent DNA helicase PcrA